MSHIPIVGFWDNKSAMDFAKIRGYLNILSRSICIIMGMGNWIQNPELVLYDIPTTGECGRHMHTKVI
jgi:hypothetical protein